MRRSARPAHTRLAQPRLALLGSTALLAASALAGHADAQTAINSGGSSSASPTYQAAFNPFQNTNGNADFSDYYFPSGSGAAQTAVITNVPNIAGAATPFEFGASDATLTEPNGSGTTQLDIWNNGTRNSGGTIVAGKPVNGLLIEVPGFAAPVTIPVNFGGITSNGAITLTDAQICGLYSGKITASTDPLLTGSGIPASAGNLTLVYRPDSSGATFLFTQHLAAVCNSTNANITFFATQSFPSLFTKAGLTIPSNFTSASGSAAVQAKVNATASSLGYLSPDYTRIAPSAYGGSAAPVVAAVLNSNNPSSSYILPTSANVSAALASGVPKTNATVNPGATLYNVNDPNSFIPVAANPAAGYPIVGYTTFLFPQCFADPNVGTYIKAFIADLYTSATYRTIIQQGGYATVPTPLGSTIRATYYGSGANGIDGTGCAGLPGR